MAEEFAYMLGIIGVGFLVNYSLRALPFLLFSGQNRPLPVWVERLGGVISPIIIGLLVVYAYSGSAWRAPWPYLAGFVTVGLQLWKRNPLFSIVTGTVLYMVLLNCCGCATSSARNVDAANPELTIRANGVYFGGEKLEADDIVEALEDAEIPKTQAIHIRTERGLKDLRAERALMALLSRGGYTRSTIVTEQHGDGNNKSGDKYKGYERMQIHDDAMFTVTRNGGVRFGLLTKVEPDDVAKCLANAGVKTDQLIRICGMADEGDDENIVLSMVALEDVIRAAGYKNVKRFWQVDPNSKKPPKKILRFTKAEPGEKITKAEPGEKVDHNWQNLDFKEPVKRSAATTESCTSTDSCTSTRAPKGVRFVSGDED